MPRKPSSREPNVLLPSENGIRCRICNLYAEQCSDKIFEERVCSSKLLEEIESEIMQSSPQPTRPFSSNSILEKPALEDFIKDLSESTTQRAILGYWSVAREPILNLNALKPPIIFSEKIISHLCKEDKVLGRGGNGVVYEGKLIFGRHLVDVALKHCSNHLGRAKQEINILLNYQHDHIIHIIGYQEKPVSESVAMLFPRMKDNLFRRLKQAVTIEPKKRYEIASQIAKALNFLHNPGNGSSSVIHLDVKSENILLDEEDFAYLSDFGSAEYLNGQVELDVDPRFGTEGYRSPEIEGHGKASTHSDVYAFGVIVLELLTGRSAMNDGTSLADEARNWFESGYHVDRTHVDRRVLNWDVSELQFLALVSRRSIQLDASKRLSMDSIIQVLKDQKTCIVCMELPRGLRLGCKHFVLCPNCIKNLEECPMCRAPIDIAQIKE